MLSKHNCVKVFHTGLEGEYIYESQVKHFNLGRMWRFYSYEYIDAIWNFAPELSPNYAKVKIVVTHA